MRQPRFVTMNGWNSYIDGHCTLTRLSCPIPDYVAHRQTVEGLDGDLDFSEAAIGRVVYQTRKLEMTFESSYGTRADRLLMLQGLTDAVHGKVCRFGLPDRPHEHLDGRTTVKLLTDASNYTEFSVSAVCSPFFVADTSTTVSLPVLSPSDNLIHTATINYNAAASSAQSASMLHNNDFVVRASGALDTAVWTVTLEPNTSYYFAVRTFVGRGTCSLSLYADADGISPGEQITTGQSGIVYLRLTKSTTATYYVSPVCIFPSSAVSRIRVGAVAAEATPVDVGQLDLSVICSGQCLIRNSAPSPVYQLPANEQDVILWVGSLPVLNPPTVPDTMKLSWRRSSL